MNNFKDHFSGHADSYAAHRPEYPDALFSFLASRCSEHVLAWDCATGNGQAARSLAAHFDSVVATDASSKQIASAMDQPGLQFKVARAEASGLQADSVNLVTVAQALHWFDIDRFFTEAIRVLKPGGVLSFWCYKRCKIDGKCSEIIEKIFAEVDSYWPPERDIVESGYRDIQMPIPELPVDEFEMHVLWTAADMLDYTRTWSASQRYISDRGADPTMGFCAELAAAWGPARRSVKWPITLRAGRK